jgi:hypothetical protein
MTCVNEECQGPCFEFDVLLMGNWTPCCRNIRWWNADGTLGGNQEEPLFCKVCRKLACHIKIEPFLRKKARIPEVVHDSCLADPWMDMAGHQWLREAARDIESMALTVAHRGVEKGKTLADARESFRKVIPYLAKKLAKDASLDIGKLTSDVILGREGVFEIPLFDKRLDSKRKA